MAESRIAITTDQKPELVSLIRRLPRILCGKLPDEHGIAAGFRARIGYAVLGLIAPNFMELARGRAGADGDKWPPLSKEYLAYGRRFGKGEQSALKKAAGLGRQHSLAPGNKQGLLNKEQLKLWKRTYADRYAWYVMRESDKKAAAHAAAVAWITVKAAGGKTKLEVFGNRQVDILVDTGYLRNSLEQGTLVENGPEAQYDKPVKTGKPKKGMTNLGGSEQIFETDDPHRVIVGSRVKYANYHHNAKSARRKRRLWPSKFPANWWRQILGVGIQGLSRISDLYRGAI